MQSPEPNPKKRESRGTFSDVFSPSSLFSLDYLSDALSFLSFSLFLFLSKSGTPLTLMVMFVFVFTLFFNVAPN